MKPSGTQRGFSLIELMIAMLIGLFLVSGLVYVYIGSKTSYNFNEGLSRLQENGRFAMHFLRQGVQEAGYLGCAENVGNITNTLNNPNGFLWDFDHGLDGFDDDDDDGTWQPSPPTEITDLNPAAGTDIITIRGVADGSVVVTAHPGNSPPGSADIQVPAPNNIFPGDILIVTDCRDAAIFQVSAGNPNTSGSIPHNTGSGSPGNSTKALGKNYAINGKVLRPETVTFYLRPPPSNPNLNSLYRVINDQNPQELVSGVEDMEILYGEDTNADRMADQYVAADAVGEMDDVVSVRIALLVSTVDQVATQPVPYSFTVFGNGSPVTPADRRLRREFVATINLRNRTP